MALYAVIDLCVALYPLAKDFLLNMNQTFQGIALLCRYGFGVGGEYPMASSSAAELAEVKPELFSLRGRQVVLVFSNQVWSKRKL